MKVFKKDFTFQASSLRAKYQIPGPNPEQPLLYLRVKNRKLEIKHTSMGKVWERLNFFP